MAKYYEKINWKDGANGGTPLSAENLNKMEEGISGAEMRAGSLEYNEETDSLAKDECLANGNKSFAYGNQVEAHGRYADAFGHTTFSGQMGFKLLALSGTEDSVGTYTLDSVEGIEIGDVYSVQGDAYGGQYGKITNIDTVNNIVTVDKYFKTVIADAKYSWKNIFFIDDKPTIGTTPNGGSAAFAEGYGSVALKVGSHAEGSSTASGMYAHSENKGEAIGYGSHAEGLGISNGYYSHAEGETTETNGRSAHAEGNQTKALARAAHTEGELTEATNTQAHAEGYLTKATGKGSHAEGNGYKATDGTKTYVIASGEGAHAEGYITRATGDYSHSEGKNTEATKEAGHSEGINTHATGASSHAEGNNTTAEEGNSHAEGGSTKATGANTHAEGQGTTSSGYAAHAEGQGTLAKGGMSHAEGVSTQANGDISHSEGEGTIANGKLQHVQGKYNLADTTSAFIIGNGSSSKRSNAMSVDWNGNLRIAGQLQDMNGKEFVPLVHFKINSTVYTCKKGTKWIDLQNTLLADLGLVIQDGNIYNLKYNTSMFLFNDAFVISNQVQAFHYIMDYRDNNDYSIDLG